MSPSDTIISNWLHRLGQQLSPRNNFKQIAVRINERSILEVYCADEKIAFKVALCLESLTAVRDQTELEGVVIFVNGWQEVYDAIAYVEAIASIVRGPITSSPDEPIAPTITPETTMQQSNQTSSNGQQTDEGQRLLNLLVAAQPEPLGKRLTACTPWFNYSNNTLYLHCKNSPLLKAIVRLEAGIHYPAEFENLTVYAFTDEAIDLLKLPE